ncbi:MAG: non-ribosomal peptide synthetase [Bryobacteraceae bacterium]
MSAQALAAPQAEALSDGTERLTYQDLERRANQLAHRLNAMGVQREAPVGLLMSRSPKAVVGSLGILKAGAAYLPLDASYPADRLAFMLSEAQVQVVVTEEACLTRLPGGSWTKVVIDHFGRTQSLGVEIQPDDLAYILYTSGSTGQPKGVMITHANLSNLVSWHLRQFEITAQDRASQVASLGFDAAVWEIWPYLAAGASVHFADENSRREPELLRDWLINHRISVSFVATPGAEHLIGLKWPADTVLRLLLTGGDTLRRYPPADLPFALVNNYGPTECTVVSTSGIVPPGGDANQLPPIGRPITNVRAYILDENQQPVKNGESGEVVIGGAGVARGYLNHPEITSESFIDDPFGTLPGAKLYRTGDLARYLDDGQISFLGRRDNQIKIRGYRIEPEEITALLTRHPAVRSAFVTAWADSLGEKRLVAYVLRDKSASPSDSALRDFLRTGLPEYMLPADFVWLDSFPLTLNGKVDRAALPEPRASASADEGALAEMRVGVMVANLLGLQQVGREDNFFLLGGHSLLGAQLIARIREVFGVNLSLRNLFEAPTVAALAGALAAEIDAKQPGRLAGVAK